MNIHMSHYRSAPPSPRVAMTHADAKPPAYLARLQQHIAMGRTPAQAMAEIERADGHRRGLPITKSDGVGGKGAKRVIVSATDRVLQCVNEEWHPIAHQNFQGIGCCKNTLLAHLKTLTARGLIECKRGSGSNPSKWRLA